MFERFTDRARHVVTRAQQEATRLGHAYIGTEHLLLGLVLEADGLAAKVLESLDIGLATVRERVEAIIGTGDRQPAPGGHIPFTPRTKKVLELSLREALQMGSADIDTEHILLGLLREGEGVAAQVLTDLGADMAGVRQRVIQLRGDPAQRPDQGGWVRGRPAEARLAGEVKQLREEVDRLRSLLREHGIEPGDAA
jgi:ATP-dependent Clp protease ATP-binding subunit ClpC